MFNTQVLERLSQAEFEARRMQEFRSNIVELEVVVARGGNPASKPDCHVVRYRNGFTTDEIKLPQLDLTEQSYPYDLPEEKWDGYKKYNGEKGLERINTTFVMKGCVFSPEQIFAKGGFHPMWAFNSENLEPSLDVLRHQEQYEENVGDAKKNTGIVSYTTCPLAAKKLAFPSDMGNRTTATVYGIILHSAIKHQDEKKAKFFDEYERSLPGGNDFGDNVILWRTVKSMGYQYGYEEFEGPICIQKSALTKLPPSIVISMCSYFLEGGEFCYIPESVLALTENTETRSNSSQSSSSSSTTTHNTANQVENDVPDEKEDVNCCCCTIS
jgi:hypothetical protein